MEIKFLKDRKNKLFIIILTVLIAIALFISAYYITYNVIGTKNSSNFVNKNNHDGIVRNTTRDLVIVNEESDGQFIEKDRIKLELTDINKILVDMYPLNEYEIVDFNDKSIVIKEIISNSFDPDMYYIGEKNGYITVFKSDVNGNLFIEDENSDISTKKVDSLPLSDRDLVLNYELKSNDRDELQDILSELET